MKNLNTVLSRLVLILVSLCLLLVSGCVSVKSNQLQQLKLLAGSSSRTEIESKIWTVRIGDYERACLPVVHDGYMTLYTNDGVEIDFSVWNVLALRNWNHYGKEVVIQRQDNEGSTLVHTLIDGTSVSLTCESSLNDSGLGKIRTAECVSKDASLPWRYTNRIEMDGQGYATRMILYIDPLMPPLELVLGGSVN